MAFTEYEHQLDSFHNVNQPTSISELTFYCYTSLKTPPLAYLMRVDVFSKCLLPWQQFIFLGVNSSPAHNFYLNQVVTESFPAIIWMDGPAIMDNGYMAREWKKYVSSALDSLILHQQISASSYLPFQKSIGKTSSGTAGLLIERQFTNSVPTSAR